MYASGPFTRVCFSYETWGIVIGVPRNHAQGVQGDKVNTIISHTAPTLWR